MSGRIWALPRCKVRLKNLGSIAKALQFIFFESFPVEGIFGLSKGSLTKIDAAYFAVLDGEELLLIDNTWFGWPDPPRWGLASLPADRHELEWKHWGHFPDLPAEWKIPSLEF
jgi:hypothetical protein